MKSDIKETAVLAFVFGIGFWSSAEAWDFVCGIISGILDMM